MGKNSGFSLIELIVVMGIFALLTAIAIPNYLKWLPKHRVGSATRDVMSAVEFARINAIKTNAAVTVNFDFGNDSLTVVDSGATTLRTHRMHSDVDLQDNGLGTPVTFNGHGFSTQAGQVIVTNSNDATISRTIMLTLGGNTSIQ